MPQHLSDSEITFRAGPVVNLASVVASLGVDPEPLIRQAGFELEDFQNPDHRIPFVKCSHLLADCVNATGCDHIGLKLGQRADPSHLGLAGFLLRAAPTTRQALLALTENIDLHDEGSELSLEFGEEYSSMHFAVKAPGATATDQICDLALSMMYQAMMALCGPEWTALAVKLPRQEPENLTPYRHFFRTTLYFNSAECGITFHSQCLENKPPAADSFLFSHLLEEARHLREIQHQDLTQELPAALRRGLLTEKFSAAEIADFFGLHERTLHRRLRAAGTSFRIELDQARQSISEQLLESTSLPVCDIASALGYADSSGFIRAFQRWSGTSPASWRKHNGRHRNVLV